MGGVECRIPFELKPRVALIARLSGRRSRRRNRSSGPLASCRFATPIDKLSVAPNAVSVFGSSTALKLFGILRLWRVLGSGDEIASA